MDVTERRYQNLRLLLEQHGTQIALAEAIGVSGSYMNHLVKRVRNIGNDKARDMERRLGLPNYWMDSDHTTATGHVLVDLSEVGDPGTRLVLARLFDEARNGNVTAEQLEAMALLLKINAANDR